MTLSKFVLRTVMLRILAAAAILLGVLQILDLLDVTTDILDRGLGIGGVAYYAALRFPRLVEQVAPLSVLAGGLFAFAQLARESAVIAMRATGVSTYRLIAMAAPAAALVMLIDYATVELIAPRTDPVLEAWWRDTAPKPPEAAGPRPFRSGADIVVAQSGDVAGALLKDVTIYRRNAAGGLAERIEAPSATFGRDGWRLQQPRMTRFTQDEAMTSTAAELIWNTALRPADVQVLLSAQQTPTAATARRALEGGGSERPASYYAVRLQKAFAGPIGIMVMLLLSAPVALGNFRNREGAILTAASLGAGLLFLVTDGLLNALGEGAALSPVLAAWTAPAVFAALATTVLLKLEG
jgi:lipopolysaccharide export system permease protein